MSEQEFESQDITNEEDERLSADFLSQLHDFMDQEEVKELNINSEDEGFRITSREQAGFFIRKVQEVRAETERVNNTATAEINRITTKVNAWREKELSRCASAEEYLTGLLRDFAETELGESDKRSLKLPFGTLAFKKQQDKYEYDDTALMQFLEDQKLEDYIQRKPSPKKAELKKQGTVKDGRLYVDGVLIEGIVITPQDDKFEVK